MYIRAAAAGFCSGLEGRCIVVGIDVAIAILDDARRGCSAHWLSLLRNFCNFAYKGGDLCVKRMSDVSAHGAD